MHQDFPSLHEIIYRYFTLPARGAAWRGTTLFIFNLNSYFVITFYMITSQMLGSQTYTVYITIFIFSTNFGNEMVTRERNRRIEIGRGRIEPLDPIST